MFHYHYRQLLVVATCVLAVALSTDPSQAGQKEYLTARASDFVAHVQQGAGEPAMVGSYAVRIYRETVDNFVAGAVGSRDGALAGLWLVDLDRDGELEVLVWHSSGGSGSYGRLDRYRFTESALIRDDPPLPSTAQLSQYMGHDVFAVVDGVLQRSFPLYVDGDSNAEPTGGFRILAYRPQNRAWILVGETGTGG